LAALCRSGKKKKVKLKSLGIGALSIRENEVLRLASEGFTDASICQTLGIAPGTLGTYWVRIRNKTTLTSRAELAAARTRYKGDRMLVRTVQVVAERVSVYGEASEPRASEIFEALPMATLVVHSDGSILAANLMAGKLLGRKASARSSLISHLLPRDVQSFLYSLQLAWNLI